MVNSRFQKKYFRISFIKTLEVLPHCHFETWRQKYSKLYFRKWLVIFEIFENKKFLRSTVCTYHPEESGQVYETTHVPISVCTHVRRYMHIRICMYVYVYVCITQIFLLYLQVTGAASARPSSLLHENTGLYAIPNVIADKNQEVRI